MPRFVIAERQAEFVVDRLRRAPPIAAMPIGIVMPVPIGIVMPVSVGIDMRLSVRIAMRMSVDGCGFNRRLRILPPRAADRDHGRCSRRQRAQPAGKRLQFAEDRLAPDLVLQRHVANVAQQLIVNAADRVRQAADKFRFGSRALGQVREHVVDVLMKVRLKVPA